MNNPRTSFENNAGKNLKTKVGLSLSAIALAAGLAGCASAESAPANPPTETEMVLTPNESGELLENEDKSVGITNDSEQSKQKYTPPPTETPTPAK